MSRQGQRNASRCHWIVWLSAVVVLTSLTSAKTIASSQHPLSANLYGEEVKRQLRTADTGTVTGRKDSGFEERAINVPLPDYLRQALAPSVIEQAKESFNRYAAMLAHDQRPTVADELFYKLRSVNDDQLISSNEFKSWAEAVMLHYNGDYAMAVEEIFTTLTIQYGETKLRKILIDQRKVSDSEHEIKLWINAQFWYWSRHRASDDDIMAKMLKLDEDGNNILTDPILLHTWIDYFERTGEVEDPYKLLFTILKRHLDERQFAEYVVIRSIDNSDIQLKIHASLVRKGMVADWKHDQMTLDDVYTLLRFDKKPGPLKSPALSMWAYYARSKGEIPESLLFTKLQKIFKDEAALARAIIAAKKTQTKPLADRLQEILFEKWQANGKTPDEVDKLLKPEGSENLDIQRAFLAASKSYKMKYGEIA